MTLIREKNIWHAVVFEGRERIIYSAPSTSFLLSRDMSDLLQRYKTYLGMLPNADLKRRIIGTHPEKEGGYVALHFLREFTVLDHLGSYRLQNISSFCADDIRPHIYNTLRLCMLDEHWIEDA